MDSEEEVDVEIRIADLYMLSLKMSTTALRGDIKQTIGLINLKFREGIQPKHIFLGSSTYVFISITDEVSKGLNLNTKRRGLRTNLGHFNIKRLVNEKEPGGCDNNANESKKMKIEN